MFDASNFPIAAAAAAAAAMMTCIWFCECVRVVSLTVPTGGRRRDGKHRTESVNDGENNGSGTDDRIPPPSPEKVNWRTGDGTRCCYVDESFLRHGGALSYRQQDGGERTMFSTENDANSCSETTRCWHVTPAVKQRRTPGGQPAMSAVTGFTLCLVPAPARADDRCDGRWGMQQSIDSLGRLACTGRPKTPWPVCCVLAVS